MKRSPLKRKTPMPRGTGFARLTRETRNPNEPAWGEKPRKPLNRVSKKNSKKHQDRSAWEAYKAANSECELIGMFPSWHEVFEAPEWMWREEYDEIHHIMHGQALRWDIPTNLIRLCKPVHDWIHVTNGAHANDGRALCLIKKAEKNELDWAELHRISGKEMPGWLLADCRKPREEWVRKLWQALIGGGE